MLQRAELNMTPQLCCAATGVPACESVAAEDSTTERVVHRLGQTIFGYRYHLLKALYEHQRER